MSQWIKEENIQHALKNRCSGYVFCLEGSANKQRNEIGRNKMCKLFCIFKIFFCNSLEFLLEKLILLFKKYLWFLKLLIPQSSSCQG